MQKTIVLGLLLLLYSAPAISEDEIKIDWEFSDHQLEILRGDLKFLSGLAFSHQDAWFAKIYKNSVQGYITERIRYLVSAQSNLADRVMGGAVLSASWRNLRFEWKCDSSTGRLQHWN